MSLCASTLLSKRGPGHEPTTELLMSALLSAWFTPWLWFGPRQQTTSVWFVGNVYVTEASPMSAVAEPGLVPPVPAATQSCRPCASRAPVSSGNTAGAAAHTTVPRCRSSSGCNTDLVLPQTFKNGNNWRFHFGTSAQSQGETQG